MKPAKTWHLSVFLEHFLPFVNSGDTPDAIVDGAVSPMILLERPSFTNSGDFLKGVDGLNRDRLEEGIASLERNNALGVMKAWRKDEAIISSLRKTRDIARRMVRIALMSGEEGGHEFWMQIREARFSHALTWNIAWVGRGNTFTTWTREGSGEPHKALASFTVAIIADAFQAVKGEPSAAVWCGVCPRESCGKIFEKKRGDQVFCGTKCQSAEKQRRYDRKITR